MEKNEFSPFYSREYHNKRNESEERLVFRWLQLLEQQHLLFNVRNKHDCLREDREEKERARLHREQPRPVVIQPFFSVTNFYGCVVCGKYHFCHLKRESCILVVDSIDKRKSCGYSGKLLPIQDNLEVANYDEDVRTDSEATYYAQPLYMRANNGASTSKKRNGSNKQHKNRVMNLFKEAFSTTTNEEEEGPRTKRPRLLSSEEKKMLVTECYDLSIGSLSEEEDDNGAPYDTKRSDNVDMDDEVEEEIAVPVTSEKYVCGNKDEGDSILNAKKSVYWQTGEEDSYGDDGETEQENENGEGSHAKNYHNNLRYKNEYYSFLKHEVAKQQKAKQHTDRYEQFIDLYKRDMKEEEPLYKNVKEEEKTEEIVREEKKLSASVCNKIEDEVKRIVRALRHIDPVKKPNCTLKSTFINERLSRYFITLVCNITLLVYQSPVLNRLAHKRSTKNRNQSIKFHVSTLDLNSAAKPQSDVDYHESTLCPIKIARALLLRLFVTEIFTITTNEGYRIQIWGRDQWLRGFPTLIYSYHNYEYGREGLARFEKEIGDTSSLIMDCLAHYNICPLWLRDRVFNGAA